MINPSEQIVTWCANASRRFHVANSSKLNQFFNVAVAEKLAALRTERYFQERAEWANREDFLAIADRAGTDALSEGDEISSAG